MDRSTASTNSSLVRSTLSLTKSIGEPMKEKFEGITLVDASTESSYVRSNGIFTAVTLIFPSFFKRYHGNQAEVVLSLSSKHTTTKDSRLTYL